MRVRQSVHSHTGRHRTHFRRRSAKINRPLNSTSNTILLHRNPFEMASLRCFVATRMHALICWWWLLSSVHFPVVSIRPIQSWQCFARTHHSSYGMRERTANITIHNAINLAFRSPTKIFRRYSAHGLYMTSHTHPHTHALRTHVCHQRFTYVCILPFLPNPFKPLRHYRGLHRHRGRHTFWTASEMRAVGGEEWRRWHVNEHRIKNFHTENSWAVRVACAFHWPIHANGQTLSAFGRRNRLHHRLCLCLSCLQPSSVSNWVSKETFAPPPPSQPSITRSSKHFKCE